MDATVTGEILDYLGRHPIMTLFWMCLFYWTIKIIVFILPNRIMRHLNIWKHGYPPEHCDADGDFKPEKSD